MQDFERLIVWQKAHAFTLRIEQLAARLRRRKPSLASQLERAADAIPAHIAEGRGRATDRDFAHFLSMAIGSSNEVQNHLRRAFDGRLIDELAYVELLESVIEIRKMLIGLRKKLI